MGRSKRFSGGGKSSLFNFIKIPLSVDFVQVITSFCLIEIGGQVQ